MVYGLLAAAAGFLLLPAAPSIGGLLIAMALLGVGGAADSVAPGAVMGDVVAGGGGTVVAVFQMAGDLGAVIGPVAAGWLADAHGYPAMFVVNAAVCAAPVLAVAAAPETLTRGERAPAAEAA
jgi:MFS family permease